MPLIIVLVITLVGLLVYMLCNSPEGGKAAEVGRIMFAFGILVLMLSLDKIPLLVR
jgi:hypothetical protein